MRLLVLSHSYPSTTRENVTPFVRYCSEALAQHSGLHVIGLLPKQQGMQLKGGEALEFQLSAKNLIPHKKIGEDHERVLCLHQLEYLVKSVSAAYRIVKRQQIDIIHAHWLLPSGLVAWIIYRLTGIPYVVTTHGRDVISAPQFGYAVSRSPILRTAMRLVLRDAAAVCTTSAVTEDGAKALCPSISPTRIPVGIDSEWMNAFANASAGDALLFVGDLIPRKAPELIIEAIRSSPLLSQKRVIIVGEGPEKPKLERQVAVASLPHVQFVGFQNRAQLADCFRRAKVLVMPSHVEGFGIVVLEALAAGLHVVSSETGIAPELAAHKPFSERCHLFKTGDSASLTLALEKTVRNSTAGDHPAMLSALRNRFTWNSIALQHISVFERVLRNTKST